MSDEQYDYTPKPSRGRKAKPAPPKREAVKARKKRSPSRSSKSFKLSSFLRSRAFMSAAGILGLVVLLGGSLLVLLPGGGASTPTGSPAEMGNYYYDQALRSWDNGDYASALTSLQEAATYYEQALAQAPEDAEVRTNLGAVLFYQSRLLSDDALLQQAIATWEVALQYEPNRPETLFNMGLGYADLGDVDQAIALWQQVLEVAPGSSAAESAARLIQEYSGVTGP